MRMRTRLKIALPSLALAVMWCRFVRGVQPFRVFRVSAVVKVSELPSARVGRYLDTAEPKDLR